MLIDGKLNKQSNKFKPQYRQPGVEKEKQSYNVKLNIAKVDEQEVKHSKMKSQWEQHLLDKLYNCISSWCILSIL